MKIRTILTVLLAISIFSCDKTGAKPEIDFYELGFENSKTALAGDELHMDAEVVAENKIDRIDIEIHPEGDEHKKSASMSPVAEEWEFDTIYTEFSGLKNTHFHKHIKVPAEAGSGHYHFHFSVTDLEGYQSVHEEEIEILATEAK